MKKFIFLKTSIRKNRLCLLPFCFAYSSTTGFENQKMPSGKQTQEQKNMKVLISNNYKALRVGQYVKADDSVGEFVFDSENCFHSVATLLEICSTNKIKAKKDKKEKVISILEAGIIKLELPQMSERPLSEVVAEIVEAGFAAGKEDDDIKIEIVQAGVPFKLANKLFTEVVTQKGFRISVADRKVAVREILIANDFEPSTYEEVTAMLEKLSDEVSDTSTAQALKAVKAYAKEFSIEIPKPAKKAKGGFKTVVQNAVVANPDMSQEEFISLCEEAGKDAEKLVASMWPNIEFVHRVVASVRAQ